MLLRLLLLLLLLLRRCCACWCWWCVCVVVVVVCVVLRLFCVSGQFFRYLRLCSLSLRPLLSGCQVHCACELPITLMMMIVPAVFDFFFCSLTCCNFCTIGRGVDWRQCKTLLSVR